MSTQIRPEQVSGLPEALEDLKKLNKNSSAIKIAVWITAIATAILAIVGIISLFKK